MLIIWPSSVAEAENTAGGKGGGISGEEEDGSPVTSKHDRERVLSLQGFHLRGFFFFFFNFRKWKE